MATKQNREQIEHDLKINLPSFTGTCKWYRHWLGTLYTDGIQYLCDKAECYWLLDIVGSVQAEPGVKGESFQVWRIELDKDDLSKAWVTAWNDTPNESKCLYRQRIEYTDFPMTEYEFYHIDGVSMLKSEY